ncbi:MAG: hypothetical protein DME34_05125 [Verrucomicrobia bacterium]|nr:MAG: hypothetical protein DME34_05125 [Verrucomicrobiota bacterium]
MNRRLATSGFAVWLILAGTGAESQQEPITSHIPRVDVESNAISEIGYSNRRHWLEIKFASGSTYRYLNVPPSVYRDVMATDSKVGYYARYIKNNYQSMRVRPRVKDEAAR